MAANRIFVIFCILVSFYCVQLKHVSKQRANATPAREDNPGIPDVPGNSKQIQEWVMSTLGATEQRLNRKIHDINGKIRKVNKTIDIEHLEGVYYFVSEELVLSEERDAVRDSKVKNLENTISVQRKEIHHLKKRLGHLEETLINLTKRLDAGSQFTAVTTSAASTPESSSLTSKLAGAIMASSPAPAIDKNRQTTTGKPLPRGEYKMSPLGKDK